MRRFASGHFNADPTFAGVSSPASVAFQALRVLLTSILAAIVCVGCSRSQRTASQVPAQHVDYFAKKRACLELAIQREARDSQEMAKLQLTPDLRSGFIWLRPEKCYVPTMNTCIYESGFMNAKTGETTMTIEDLLTGQEFTRATFVNPTPEYQQEKGRLFALCAK